MKLDPVRDIAPPALGSWWKDRITGRRYEVVSYHKWLGRYVQWVEVKEPGTGLLAVQRVKFDRFYDQFVPADPPPGAA